MKKTWTIALCLLAACSNTHITSSWRNDRIPSVRYTKIIVLAMVPDSQRNVRQAMETSMAEQLTRNGYAAVSALQAFGPHSFEGLSEQASVSKVHQANADGLVTISQTDHRRTREYVPGAIYPSPWGWGWGGGYYSPGYVRSQNRFSWQTNFYDVSSDKVVYSVQSRSFDPSSTHELGESYSKRVVRDMKDKGVLVKPSRKDLADK